MIMAVIMSAAEGGARELSVIPQPRHTEWLSDINLIPADIQPRIKVDSLSTDVTRPEGYILTITPECITIEARDGNGVIWAERTLQQLRLPDGSYPAVRITDYPEFPIRGFMYDYGRNFVGTHRVKEFIDLISAYKLNVFQWHLTDKPAWRIVNQEDIPMV